MLVAGKEIALDPEGFLKDIADWSELVARALAEEEGIELTQAHWQVLYLLREFYDAFALSPATRALVKYAGARLGPELGNSTQLNLLFKGRPAKLGAKLAGLPKPPNCI